MLFRYDKPSRAAAEQHSIGIGKYGTRRQSTGITLLNIIRMTDGMIRKVKIM